MQKKCWVPVTSVTLCSKSCIMVTSMCVARQNVYCVCMRVYAWMRVCVCMRVPVTQVRACTCGCACVWVCVGRVYVPDNPSLYFWYAHTNTTQIYIHTHTQHTHPTGKDLSTSLSRDQFEALSAGIFDEMLLPLQQVRNLKYFKRFWRMHVPRGGFFKCCRTWQWGICLFMPDPFISPPTHLTSYVRTHTHTNLTLSLSLFLSCSPKAKFLWEMWPP